MTGHAKWLWSQYWPKQSWLWFPAIIQACFLRPISRAADQMCRRATVISESVAVSGTRLFKSIISFQKRSARGYADSGLCTFWFLDPWLLRNNFHLNWKLSLGVCGRAVSYHGALTERIFFFISLWMNFHFRHISNFHLNKSNNQRWSEPHFTGITHIHSLLKKKLHQQCFLFFVLFFF